MRNLGSIVTIIFLGSWLAGCGIQSKSELKGQKKDTGVQAPSNPEESFFVVSREDFLRGAASDVSIVDKFLLGINKNSLEKEFLLSGSIIPQAGAPTSSGLHGRIVAFRRSGNSVFLLEATQGHVVTGDLPATLILAELPILKEETDKLVVDFNKGMKKVFVKGWYHTSDYASREATPRTKAMETTHSFLDSVRFIKPYLELRQIAQLRDPDGSLFPTVEVRYFLSPYRPAANFVAKKTSDFDWVGYFEVAPKLKLTEGSQVVHIGKFNHNGPIKFYVSSNTPLEYVQAVKDGILYWNKAFGRNVLEAHLAPVGVTAPDPRYNIVQWVPWDNAGFAYADALIDPRTGEIQHAQVYLTSAFAVIARKRVAYLKRLLEEVKKNGRQGAWKVGLDFLGHNRLCDLEILNPFIDALERLASMRNITDEAVYRISQDWVRLVAAHEIGHTLGLRHNFAGNLHSNVHPHERETLYHDYLMNKVVPDPAQHRVTSSVMEYMNFEDDTIAGQQMLTAKEAFDYDAQAIQWGYYGKDIDPAKAALFCTDSSRGKLEDCQVFDSGPASLVAAVQERRIQMKSVVPAFVENFINAKAPLDPADEKPFNELNLKATGLANRVLATIATPLKWLKKDSRSLRVERQFPFIGPLNKEEVEETKMDQVRTEIAQVGGVDALLFSLLPDASQPESQIAEDLIKELDVYLAKPEIVEGTASSGRTYRFSTDEINHIKDIAKKFFVQFEDAVLAGVVQNLSKAKFEEPTTLEDLEKKLGEVAIALMTSGATDPSVAPTATFKPYEFTYSSKLRKAAAGLVAAKLGDLPDFASTQKKELKAAVEKVLEGVYGKKIGELDESTLSREARQYLMKERAVLGAI